MCKFVCVSAQKPEEGIGSLPLLLFIHLTQGLSLNLELASFWLARDNHPTISAQLSAGAADMCRVMPKLLSKRLYSRH